MFELSVCVLIMIFIISLVFYFLANIKHPFCSPTTLRLREMLGLG